MHGPDWDALDILSKAKLNALFSIHDWPQEPYETRGHLYDRLDAWRIASNAWDRLLKLKQD